MNNSSLTHLVLNDNDFSIPDPRESSCRYSGMQVKEMLYEVQCLISYNQRLHNLKVESCGVKDDLAKLFGIGMFQNKQLTSLSLAHNKLTDQFIKPFVAGLEKCSSMRELNLSHNNLGDLTARLFVHLLRTSNNQIVSLDLSNNMLTKRVIGDLQLVIDDCPRIRYLNTDMNLGISHA